jgi:hypothetical protein
MRGAEPRYHDAPTAREKRRAVMDVTSARSSMVATLLGDELTLSSRSAAMAAADKLARKAMAPICEVIATRQSALGNTGGEI